MSFAALRAVMHELDLQEDAWVEELVHEARGLFDEGLGTFAYTYRFGPDTSIRLGSVAGAQTALGFWRTLEAWGAENQSALACMYRTSVGFLEGAMRAAANNRVPLSNPAAMFEAHGVADIFTLVGHDEGGFGIFLTVPCPRASRGLTRKERAALERVSAELVAVLRLREHRRHRKCVQLSASEKRVAQLLMVGASDKAIASELQVTLSTVATFTRRVREKLRCQAGEEVLLLSSHLAGKALRPRVQLFDEFTASECEIAAELLVGSSYARIAQRRGSSVRTVASQCATIFRKCGVSGRRELSAKLLVGSRQENDDSREPRCA